jgi:hypothetical protein
MTTSLPANRLATEPPGRPAAEPPGPAYSPTLWRVAGALALAHVVLMLVGVITMGTPTIHEGQEGIEHSYVEGSLGRIFTGGFIELLAFVLMVPVLVFLGRAFGRRTEGGAWASQSAAAAGLGYVAVVVAAGFSAGAAAAWGAADGLDLQTVLTINNIRNFGYFLSLALLGAHAIGLGIAALGDRVMTRWAGWGGIATGVCLVAAVPAASIGVQDYATVVWLVWWVGLAVLMLRRSAAER